MVNPTLNQGDGLKPAGLSASLPPSLPLSEQVVA